MSVVDSAVNLAAQSTVQTTGQPAYKAESTVRSSSNGCLIPTVLHNARQGIRPAERRGRTWSTVRNILPGRRSSVWRSVVDPTATGKLAGAAFFPTEIEPCQLIFRNLRWVAAPDVVTRRIPETKGSIRAENEIARI